MKIKIGFQYIISGVVIFLIFASLLWRRTEFLLKEYIVDSALVHVHDRNISKAKELELKLNYYLLSANAIYDKLTTDREVNAVDSIDRDIVGADLVVLKDSKYHVKSSFFDLKFAQSRQLSQDYLKEIVGHNPIDFNQLNYSVTLVQKLNSVPAKNTDLLALIVNLKNTNFLSKSPYFLVIYIDLLRFKSLLQYQDDMKQVLFEPTGGLIASSAPVDDFVLSNYIPYTDMTSRKLSIYKNSYGPEGDRKFYSLMMLDSNIFVGTEISEMDVLKPVNIIKSNYSLAFSIAIALLILIFSVISFFFVDKISGIKQQILGYVEKRKTSKIAFYSFFSDEFDDISNELSVGFSQLQKNIKYDNLISRFAKSSIADAIQYRKIDLQNKKTFGFFVRWSFGFKSQTEDTTYFWQKRNELVGKVVQVVNDNNGVIVSSDSNSMTFAFGLFIDGQQDLFLGLKSCLEIQDFLREQLAASDCPIIDSTLFCAAGEVIVNEAHEVGVLDLTMVGAPMEQLRQVSPSLSNSRCPVFVTQEVQVIGSSHFYFGVVSEQNSGIAKVETSTRRSVLGSIYLCELVSQIDKASILDSGRGSL